MDASGLPFPDGATILFQGDSITDGARGRTDDPNHIFGHGYVFLIASLYGAHFPQHNWNFINRAIGGNKVTDMEARWQTDAIALQPDVLSVLIGVNDTASFVQDETDIVTAAQYEQVYDTILAAALAANPNIKFLLGQPFIGTNGAILAHPDEWKAEIKLRQDIVDRLAEKYRAPVVRYQAMFDAAVERAPSAYWIWDGVHPTAAGHALMADEWVRTVAAFYGPR